MTHRTLLSEADIQNALITLPGWTSEGTKLHRQFEFDDFLQAFAFMTQCALKAEKMDHHPEWSNVYNRVEVWLSTHDQGGVTALDIELAHAMSKAALNSSINS